jgi:hypothetical protein
MWSARRSVQQGPPAAGVCAALMIAGLAAPASAAAVELRPVADTYVDAGKPRSTHGSARTLRTSRSPVRRAYLRFGAGAEAGTLSRAVLRVYLKDRRGGRVKVHAVVAGSRWNERRATFARAPGVARSTARSRRLQRRGWTGIDVTSLITAGRQTELALGGAPRASIASRESPRPPRLILQIVPPPPPPALVPAPGWPPAVPSIDPPGRPPVPPGPPPVPPAPGVDPAMLTITQEIEPDAAASFAYTATGLDAFTLTGDATRTVTVSSPRRMTIAQQPVPGWTLVDVDCTGALTSDPEAGTVTVDLTAGAAVECAFHNQQDATVTVLQDSDPASGPAVSYAGTLGDFELTGDGEQAFTVGPGRFGPATIAQAPVSGWTPSPPACTGDSDATIAARSATLSVDPGETIECRFALEQPALVAGIYPETSSRIGPFVDGNGNLYTVTEVIAGDNRPAIRKSTDAGRTWSEVGAASRPTVADLESVSLVQDGTRIHMLHQRSGYKVYYNAFNTSDAPASPDTWVVRNEVVFAGNATPSAPQDQAASAAVRSNGDVVAFYVVSDMEIAYRKRDADSGDWGAETVLATAPDERLLTEVLVERSTVDETLHIAYKEHTKTEGLNSRILYRTLSPHDVVSPPVTVAVNAVSGYTAYKAMPNRGLVVLGADGVDRVLVAWCRSDGRLAAAEIRGDVAGPEQLIAEAIAYQNPPNILSKQVVAALAPDTAAGTVRALYADRDTHDLWTDVHSGDWGADAELLDGTDVMAINANVFRHSAANGGRRVLGILFDQDTGTVDAGAVHYVEVELPSSGR